MLEDKQREIPLAQLSDGLTLGAHEIKTLRLVLPEITRQHINTELGERTVYKYERGGLLDQQRAKRGGKELKEVREGEKQYLGHE